MYLLVCLLCFQLLSWAGVVTGTVKDAETGEELVGATLITENGVGATTDIDGKYTVSLPSGVHTLTVRYVGYKSEEKKITIEGNSAAMTLDFMLLPNVNMLRDAVVTGTARHNTETAAVKEQQEAHVTMTGVSEQQIKKTQDKNAGEVIRRIPGVSIIDEKFVMVRGLVTAL